MDDLAKVGYDVILGRYLLTELVLNLIFSDHVVERYDGPFKGSMAPIVGMGTYEFTVF